jgi:hypothetical protein
MIIIASWAAISLLSVIADCPDQTFEFNSHLAGRRLSASMTGDDIDIQRFP